MSKSQHSSHCQHISPLPVELWRHIFSFSTTIPGKDEFSHDVRAFGSMPHNREDILATLTPEELSFILKTRHTIVRVCRRWYAIGIEALWSHLRVEGRSWRSQLEVIHQAVETNPYLAPFVIRLTAEVELGSFRLRPEDTTNSSVTHILSKFKNLRIFNSAWGDIAGQFPPSVELATLGSAPQGNHGFFNLNPDVISRLCTLKSLTLDCRTVTFTLPPSSLAAIVFPNLTTLRIETSHDTFCSHITDMWYFPVLQTLSLIGTGARYWMNLVQRCRNTIEQLELQVWDSRHTFPDMDPWDMPVLSTLSLDPTQYGPWLTLMKAPILQHVALWNVDFIEGFNSRPTQLVESAQNIKSHYPSIRNLHIYELGRALSPRTRYGLSRQDIVALGEGGVTVVVCADVRSQMRAEADRKIPYRTPSDALWSTLRNHPDLKSTIDEVSVSLQGYDDQDSRLWQASYSVGKYRATGESSFSASTAKDSAAACFLDLIRADIF